jgi:hypothetical protein
MLVGRARLPGPQLVEAPDSSSHDP